ncbi:hypothetical protein Lfu02_76980 [Longispora fulva]|uniref:Uncharacterized protein n=1 Tax=Longispora fulva TaxID=619741 RepID=A0A8J7GNY4_9ACTN|nr:hypothetical protein [Longispora fulva]MBG6136184.1 hypothetical protein [Longispora fulva]GIG63326.1 hypothetical protein Lfu02_76980 [Longispora fulva]
MNSVRESKSMKNTLRVLLTAAVAGSSLFGIATSAQAGTTPNPGCRYDYASVGYGYSLRPCTEFGGSAEVIAASIKVKVAAHATDVYICGQLIPVTGWNASVGDEICTYYAGTGSSGASFTTDYARQGCSELLYFTDTDYVYKAYIRENGQNIGDVESGRFTCKK